MTDPIRQSPRPGGRSARVQAAVHRAVRELQAEAGREELGIVQIAARAGVTPSTIYRRWGDLQALLGDVAVERLWPDAEPASTGSLRGDLYAWAEQYLDEMSSPMGRTLLRDTLAASGDRPMRCADIVRNQLEIILARVKDGGTTVPSADQWVDAVVAPMTYRILFAAEPPSIGHIQRLIDERLQSAGEVDLAPSAG